MVKIKPNFNTVTLPTPTQPTQQPTPARKTKESAVNAAITDAETKISGSYNKLLDEFDKLLGYPPGTPINKLDSNKALSVPLKSLNLKQADKLVGAIYETINEFAKGVALLPPSLRKENGLDQELNFLQSWMGMSSNVDLSNISAHAFLSELSNIILPKLAVAVQDLRATEMINDAINHDNIEKAREKSAKTGHSKSHLPDPNEDD